MLNKAIDHAKQYVRITDEDINTIMHSRKSLLFNNEAAWVKKNGNVFDVTMGSYDGAEVCELVGLYILFKLRRICDRENIGLYRDDGLAVFKDKSGPELERIKKEIVKSFKELGLRIVIHMNLKIVNFLDITLDLTSSTYSPYRKPNDNPLYISTKSNHPSTIIKHLPAAINKRLSDISSNEAVFNKSTGIYQNALKSSGYQVDLQYSKQDPSTRQRRNRKRNIIWFNPPFSKSVKSNIGKSFLHLLSQHFPPSHKLHRIFNRNSVKVSYSCMSNMKTVINNHNKKVLNNVTEDITNGCNCRSKRQCPLDNQCLTSNVIYKASVTCDDVEKSYIGLTEGPFKTRYLAHKSTFKHRKYEKSTQLSKYIWKLKDRQKDFQIRWSVVKRAYAYRNGSKRCNLCLEEKLCILKSNETQTLNKRSEIISKCRHENKFYLKNFKHKSAM